MMEKNISMEHYHNHITKKSHEDEDKNSRVLESNTKADLTSQLARFD